MLLRVESSNGVNQQSEPTPFWVESSSIGT